ncbi:MAG: molybdopterin synthase sulfur carrier subunit [Thermofilum sp. ex4484_82]|nr:MAG: molybdopterin synthase sulfur carrier subunit [Thermofilum sp. ex4484_82]OYT39670.1 MAG: molybdopterin synthase sulfur carrier subunit [Archaeoglobales archaeon ex4484_92]RLE76312.1 MAG: MoaD/ThiS family protein [Thermoprotei archaeon]
MVRIKYIGYLADLVGKRKEEIQVKLPVKIKNILKLKNVDMEELVVLVNGRAGNLDTIVSGDDEISILPVISGG